MHTFTIIGFGRFGKTLARLLKDTIKQEKTLLFIIDPFVPAQEILDFTKKLNIPENKIKVFQTPKDFYTYLAQKLDRKDQQNVHFIFFAVPINKFEKIFKQHLRFLHSNHVVVDVLSVKTHPYKVFKKALKEDPKLQFILTHPMFGPDSSRNGFNGLRMVMHNLSARKQNYNRLKKIFKEKGLKIIEMDPKTHDKYAAYSQGVAHFIGRMLKAFDFAPTPIDTKGAEKLYEIMQQTVNDTWELFYDLQHYNPYTKKMRTKLGSAYKKIYNKLLPKRVNPPYTTIGIQGGVGSFNEIAYQKFIKEYNIKNPKIKYLYTTERVLSNLYRGNIDIGIFAIHNAQGGLVWESARALAKYNIKIIAEFYILVRHFLMKRKDTKLEEITQIMAHPQVFKQCKNNLAKKYPHLKQIVGKGPLIDTAYAAKQLAEGKLPKGTAILGPQILADIYDLEIIDHDLQDLKDNKTWFLGVVMG